tara:strand:- start:413 stop:541 length:129 start_codon:yes stop_codon:yes gene_type:complete
LDGVFSGVVTRKLPAGMTEQRRSVLADKFIKRFAVTRLVGRY